MNSYQTDNFHRYLQSLDKEAEQSYRRTQEPSPSQTLQKTGSSQMSHNLQNSQIPTYSVLTFGDFQLQKCYDKKFRAPKSINLTEKQQCLLDNLWHLKTLPESAGSKAYVLNALCSYFYDKSKKPQKNKTKFFPIMLFLEAQKLVFSTNGKPL